MFLFASSCKVSESKGPNQDYTDADSVVVVEPKEVNLPQHFPSEYRGARTRFIDLVHTKLEVSFDWEQQYLFGVATLELSPHFYPQDRLILDAKGFDIDYVHLLNAEGETPLEYTYNGKELNIELNRPYYIDENFLVSIKYTAKPNELKVKGSDAITSDKGLYFINPTGEDPNKPKEIWTQGETEASSCWFPTIDSPNQRSTQEMYITVDDEFKTLSNGKLVYSRENVNGTRTDYWNMDLPHAPYLFMMAVGDFAIVKDKWKNIAVDYYVEPDYEKYANSIFGNTPEMMGFFSKILNYNYPWQKYSQVVVRDYVSGAMENTTASVFMEALQVDNRYLLADNWDGIIAHELFHQWFGDLVTCESWSNLPLNESFANYGEYLWAEYKYGKDAADFEGLKEMESYFREAKSKQVDMIRYYYQDKEDMFDSHSYAKGGRILHMLRTIVGDDAFFTSLHEYLKENEYTAVEIHQLRLAFERVTGEDLHWFFDQWFLASGHPQLNLEHTYQERQLKLVVQQIQDFRTTPLYKLPVDIDVWVNGQKKRFSVIVDSIYNEFTFDLPDQPELVLFDGEQYLLAEINNTQTFEELSAQYRLSDKFLARYRAVEALSDTLSVPTAGATVFAALDDSFWAIRQLAIHSLDKYDGPGKAKVEQKLAQMGKDDPNPKVKADALAALEFYGADKYRNLYKGGLADSSYVVNGAALYGYLQTAAEDKDEVVHSFEGYADANVQLAVANYFVENKRYDKYDWFTDNLAKSKGVEKYYLINLFGQLLINAPEGLQKAGAALLEPIALEDSSYFIRLSAFQALLLLDNVEGVPEMRKRIKENETDERLIEYYENF
nr:M1 family metallopeptidase [Xanthovirga aplysinae]